MPLSAARTLLCGPRYALSFDGKSSYVEVPHSDVLSITRDLTIVTWIRSPDYTLHRYYGVVSKGEREYIIQTDYGKLRYVHQTGGSWVSVTSTLTLPTKTWVFVGVVRKWTGTSYDVTFYRNLDSETRTGITGPADASTRSVYIGVSIPGYWYFYGANSEVLIYSRDLSDKEMTWNFNHRDNPVRNGLVMWLHWDSIDISAGKWYDKTVFGNHGTIYGATLVEPIRAKARILSPVRTLTPVR